VWPGDDLSATAEVTAIDTGDDPTVTLSVTTTNAAGVTVFTAEAVASINA
jgi:acyl dehydratase